MGGRYGHVESGLYAFYPRAKTVLWFAATPTQALYHSTGRRYWRDRIGGVDINNYTVNDIKNVCRTQRHQLGKRIKADEVVIPLSRLEQVDEELEESLIKFLEKTPMGKQMTKLYRTDDDEGGDDKKKKKK